MRISDWSSDVCSSDLINFTEETTNQAITDQIAVMREYLLANQSLFPPEIFERAMANLEAYNAQLAYTNTMTTAIKQSAEQAFTQGFMTMFDTLAQGR